MPSTVMAGSMSAPRAVDWRLHLRRIINRDSDLSRWRLASLRVIDPVEWYIRKAEPRLPRRAKRGQSHGWASYEPMHEPLASAWMPSSPPSPPKDGHESYERRSSEFETSFASYFEEKATQLLRGEEAVLETTSGTVRARLVRFRNGAVYEHRASSPTHEEHGQSRIERRQFQDAVPVLVELLTGSIEGLGPGARPLS